MLGSVIAAMVCLQSAAPTDAQELAKFRDVAAKPEWSMADLMFLGSALQSKFEPVRRAALDFWPDKYPDAWEDFRYLNRYDDEKSGTFWSTIVEPGYKALLKRQGSQNWVGAVRSLLKLGSEPKPRNLGCGKPGPRGSEWYETLDQSNFAALPHLMKFAFDADPMVSFNAVERLSSGHPFLKSQTLRSWLHTNRPERLWAALNNFEPNSTQQWLEDTKHLLLSHDQKLRSAVVFKFPLGKPNFALALSIAVALPDYARSEGILLLLTNRDKAHTKELRRYLANALTSRSALERTMAMLLMDQTDGSIGEVDLVRLAMDADDEVATFAIRTLEQRGFEVSEAMRNRMWRICPSVQLDTATVNTAKPPPDWALKKYIDTVESGSEGGYLEEEFARIVSRELPLHAWLKSSLPGTVRTALRMIPIDRVNDFAKPILSLVLSKDEAIRDLAIFQTRKITFPDDRSQLFQFLNLLSGEAKTELRDNLCEQDDRVSRHYLASWRNSRNREERMFARRTLYFFDHPLEDN